MPEMDANLIAALKSPLPADRKRGLQMLANSDNPQTLNILSKLYKRETDPELKQLIMHIGKTVKQRVEAVEVSKKEDVTAIPDSSDYITQAAAMMQQAQQFLAKGDIQRAKEVAMGALVFNPDLRNEEDARKLIQAIFGDETDKILATLPKSHADLKQATSVPIFGIPGFGIPLVAPVNTETKWSTALLDAAMFGLFSGVAMFVVMLFFGFLSGDAGADEVITTMPGLLGASGILGSAITAVIVAIVSMIFYLVWFGIIHLIATTFLKGTGTYRGMLRSAFLPMIVFVIVASMVVAVTWYFNPEATLSVSVGSSSSDDFDDSSVQTNFGGIIFLLFSAWLASVTANNYGFGYHRGCAVMVLSSIVLVGLSCGCLFFMFPGQGSDSAILDFIPRLL